MITYSELRSALEEAGVRRLEAIALADKVYSILLRRKREARERNEQDQQNHPR